MLLSRNKFFIVKNLNKCEPVFSPYSFSHYSALGGQVYAQVSFSDQPPAQIQRAGEAIQAITTKVAEQLSESEVAVTSTTVTVNGIVVEESAVEFYFHRPTFDFEVCVDGDLTLEDFIEATDFSFCGRPSGLNSATAGVNGNCFPAGSIDPGFNYRTNTGRTLAIFGANSFGAHPEAVAPNFFADNAIIDITEAGVRAVSFDFVDQPNVIFGNGSATHTLSVFGPGGIFLGATTFNAGGGTQFVGFTTEEDITRFEITHPSAGKPIANLAYGTCDGLNVIAYGCDGDADYNESTDITTVSATNCLTTPPYQEDELVFVYKELCGNGEIIAKVENVEASSWAGIMMAESLDEDSKWAEQDVQLEVLSSNGTRMLATQIGAFEGTRTELQLDQLPVGVYWLRIQPTNAAPMMRLIVVQ